MKVINFELIVDLAVRQVELISQFDFVNPESQRGITESQHSDLRRLQIGGRLRLKAVLRTPFSRLSQQKTTYTKSSARNSYLVHEFLQYAPDVWLGVNDKC